MTAPTRSSQGTEPTKRQFDEQTPLLASRTATDSQDASDSASGSGSVFNVNGADGSTTSASDTSTAEPSTLDDVERGAPAEGRKPTSTLLKVVFILMLGMFTANADSSLVLATHPTIASEFNDLKDSSWLFTAFTLAGAATQAIYGKLSDIYGRRALLVISYSFFAIGCFIVGIGHSMWEVILGRVISGSGGSAIVVVTALLITDLVPLRDIAAWQAGINLASTIGRSLGGPLGGWLADTIGWRWSFLGQAPIFMFALLLCLAYLPPAQIKTGQKESSEPVTEQGSDDPLTDNAEGNDRGHKMANSPLFRIDWLGALLLALLLLSFLTPIEIGIENLPFVLACLGATVVLAGLFILTEARWATEPILPLELFRHRDVLVSYFVAGSQAAAQLGLMFAVPLYFQVSQRASNTVAGAHLFPAVGGNAIGGILAGFLIKRYGRYKYLILLATTCSSVAYLLLFLRWHGNTNIWESLYIVPGGFGMGVVQSAAFVSIQASVSPSTKAAATSVLYLSVSVGTIFGLASVGAIVTETMKWRLASSLDELGFGDSLKREIVEKAAASIDYLDKVEGVVAKAIVEAYLEGLTLSHAVSLACSVLAFLVALLLREHKLE